jgi:hypothetical protein
MGERDQRRHISIGGFVTAERFSAKPAPQSAEVAVRRRAEHGRALLAQIQRIADRVDAISAERHALAEGIPDGVYVTLESEPDFELKLESLDRARAGIELLSAQTRGRRTIATVFVPEGQLVEFEKLVRDYMSRETRTGQPRNKELIANIRSIRLTVLRHLWVDPIEYLPRANDGAVWWEVWLRDDEGVRAGVVDRFRQHAAQMQIEVPDLFMHFPGRTVVAARATLEQMTRSATLLNLVSELRKFRETAAFWTELRAGDQWQWSDDLERRITVDADSRISVCLLDSGLNLHPLLAPLVPENGRNSIDPAWTTDDALGHGTQMGGLAAFGDLVDVLPTNHPLAVGHWLESVRVLRQNHDNEGKLFGAITREAVARAEVSNPEFERIICLSITGDAVEGRGRPSEWSAAIDANAAGVDDGRKRLYVIAAGNVAEYDHHRYMASNTASPVENPGQSWNALTVGACTFKAMFNANAYPGANTVARSGGLSPYSRTTATWASGWPHKPDVVFEGGNRLLLGAGMADSTPSLDLLTVHHRFVDRPFDTFWGTSAGTALCARMAAQIATRYPEYWPETLRALIVHSADWTDEMRDSCAARTRAQTIANLLRHCGFGTPSLDAALWSAGNALTLVAQRTIQPFRAERSARGTIQRARSNEMHLYELPWPIQALRDVGPTNVELRVTLSYFIEPNPSQRGWSGRYRYESHGLRFAVRHQTESTRTFRHRINAFARAEEAGEAIRQTDEGWVIGSQARHRGSIHSDRWIGPASDLADRGVIAVFPTLGWWRELKKYERVEDEARYSLVVSIRAEGVPVDLYAPVAAQVDVPIEVAG